MAEMINNKNWVEVYEGMCRVINICYPMIKRWREEPLGEDPKSYKKAVKDCCRANGFQYVRIGEDIKKINIKIMLNSKIYRIVIYITDQGAEYKIIHCKN